MPHAKGSSSTALQLSLLRYVALLIPSKCKVSLVGDAEFDNTQVIEQLQEWGWDYALRQMPRTLIMLKNEDDWRKISSLDVKRGDEICYRKVLLTEKNQITTNLVCVWHKGEKETWFLATNQGSAKMAVFLYKRRMWIEEMFGDMKKHGFNLEVSRLHHAERLSRLMLVVAILYVWLVTLGEHVIQQGLHAAVDRSKNPELSIFRLGWDWLERQLTLCYPIPLLFRTQFSLIPFNELLSSQRAYLHKLFGVR